MVEILAVKLIMEKGKTAYVRFVDLQKSSYNDNWKEMFEILEKIAIKYLQRKNNI